MAVWVKHIPWGFLFMLAGAVGQFVIRPRVNYPPPPVCAVKGSTVTLPCTFTPLRTIYQDGTEVPVVINRVVWCQNHIICHGDTPSVYDSDKPNQNPRYSYLGDKKGNCTLQITDVQTEDNATLYFRMESSDGVSHHTGRSGVKVAVADATRMKIKSDKDRELTRGDTVSLTCTTIVPCTFHDLEVTWFKDGHALSQSGPSLQLGPLTAKHSGNYTCGLGRNDNTQSLPISIHVEGGDEETESFSLSMNQLLAVRLLLFMLHTGLFVTVASVIIKRTCFKSSRRDMRERRTLQPTDFVEEQ